MTLFIVLGFLVDEYKRMKSKKGGKRWTQLQE